MNIVNRTIYCRDNLDILRNIDSECVDMIYLDPPFNKKKSFPFTSDGLEDARKARDERRRGSSFETGTSHHHLRKE